MRAPRCTPTLAARHLTQENTMNHGLVRSTGHRLHSTLIVLVLASLAGCGGGSSSDTGSQPAPTSTSVPVTVIDGAIKGAVVCLDKNSNGVCDDGEPTATTDASGNAALTVDNADVGKFPIVAMVGTDAVDAETGPVASAYILQAPADQTAVASPLTTMVQAQLATSGGTSVQAASIVKTQTGLAFSLFDNYTLTKATGADAAAAANLARLIVLTTQQQGASLASLVGQTDTSGATITQADLQRAIVKSLVGVLPALASAASSSTVTGAATPAALDAALSALATTLVDDGQAGLNATTAPAAIGFAKLAPEGSSITASGVSASFRALTFTDANNWFFRAMESTAADNTPDASGLVHYYDNRTKDVAGTITSWGFNSNSARQGDLHWNGTAWVDCPLGFRSAQYPRDANGITQYNYCDSYELGVSQRSGADISGKLLTDVIATIRAFPGSDSGVAYSSFGPTDLSLLGSATFPTGSSLYYYANQATSTALAYDVTSQVSGYSVAIAAGGDTVADPSVACAVVTPTNFSTYYQPIATLEALIAQNPGKPCYYGPTTGGYPISNEWWGNSTIGAGTIVGGVVSPAPVFNTNEALRLAFTPTGNVVTYLSCLTRISDNSQRSCTALGTGTYAIQTLGGGRVLTTTNVPPEFVRLGYARTFVERGGNVYYGYQVVPGTKSLSVRLNMPAGNALLGQLGMPLLAPN
jgi:trimeric autotransporter adhesin